jgi:hypothetical protein
MMKARIGLSADQFTAGCGGGAPPPDVVPEPTLQQLHAQGGQV